MNFEPLLLALGIAATALLTILTACAPVLRSLLVAHLKAKELAELRLAVAAAAVIVSSAAKLTPTTADDALARVLHLVEQEVGKALATKHAALIRASANQIHQALAPKGE